MSDIFSTTTNVVYLLIIFSAQGTQFSWAKILN